ncbi:putative RNA-dependent RNA polymerase 1 [Porphyridium purpureum]|uniref:RNA-directed RNA polymerase n=1 Tax=Porphyridium purpureum TaxID=35688 RepID=A0A5J4YIY4_PORPP|nr:putative RNA-dependent RNA polymerase 1 [Porphyridium purpureum]|eukprot:POR6447..scf270_19
MSDNGSSFSSTRLRFTIHGDNAELLRARVPQEEEMLRREALARVAELELEEQYQLICTRAVRVKGISTATSEREVYLLLTELCGDITSLNYTPGAVHELNAGKATVIFENAQAAYRCLAYKGSTQLVLNDAPLSMSRETNRRADNAFVVLKTVENYSSTERSMTVLPVARTMQIWYQQHPDRTSPSKRSIEVGDTWASLLPMHQSLPVDPVVECQTFIRTGWCKYGIRCRHYHPINTNPREPVRGECFSFVQTGVCPFRKVCRYRHPERSRKDRFVAQLAGPLSCEWDGSEEADSDWCGFRVDQLSPDTVPPTKQMRLDIKLSTVEGFMYLDRMQDISRLTLRFNRPPYVFVEDGGDPYLAHMGVQCAKTHPDDMKLHSTWSRVCSEQSDANVLARCNAIQLVLQHTNDHSRDQFNSVLRRLARLHARPGGADACKADARFPLKTRELNEQEALTAFSTPAAECSFSFRLRYILEQIRTAGFGCSSDPVARIVAIAHAAGPAWVDIERVLQDGLPVLLTAARRPSYTSSKLTTRSRLIFEEVATKLQRTIARRRSSHTSGQNDVDPSFPSGSSQLSMVFVGQILVTPTRLLCTSTHDEHPHRAFRVFMELTGLSVSEAEGLFLRVSFVDENQSKLLCNGIPGDGDNTQTVYAHFRQVLEDGVIVAGRKFVFLAWSNSMLKEHACWFVAECAKVLGKEAFCTAELLRGRLGDFSEILVVAKCAARLGQCFSTAVPTLTLSSDQITRIDDMKTVCGKSAFSDGVGCISSDLAEQVSAQYLERTSSPSKVTRTFGSQPESPSGHARPRLAPAFQIRLGGCKGVLSVDPRMPQGSVYTRPSMIKFASTDTTLEVCEIARCLPAWLNRQLIVLLTTNGVSDGVFESMLKTDLSIIRDAFTNTAAAVSLLSNSDYFGARFFFFRQLVAAVARSHLQDMRTRARIRVPHALVAMGAMDETKLLQYGELFCVRTDLERFTAGDGNRAGIVPPPEKLVTVTRFPCLHPGDIRTLRAVSVEELASRVRQKGTSEQARVREYFSAQRDGTILLSSHGSRPHASEMSGGDLHGDLFWLSWNPALLPPPKSRNMRAMDYSAPTPKEVVADASAPGRAASGIPISPILDFFIDFMKNDKLGIIDSAHMAHADWYLTGAANAKCKQLAAVHSTSVDFQKTGVPAEFSKELRAHRVPDFMESATQETYISQKVLGRMFRTVMKLLNQVTHLETSSETLVVERGESFLLPDRVLFDSVAARHYEAWQDDIFSLMVKYGVRTEGELLGGHVDRFYSNPYREKRKYDAQELVRRDVGAVKDKHRAEFERVVAQFEPELQDRMALLLASAYYDVSYRTAASHAARAAAEGHMSAALRPVRGLPWLFTDCLHVQDVCGAVAQMSRWMSVEVDAEKPAQFRLPQLPIPLSRATYMPSCYPVGVYTFRGKKVFWNGRRTRACCQHDACSKLRQGGTMLCFAHGGGHRCKRDDCSKAAQGPGQYCYSHGGGRRCQHDGCTKSAAVAPSKLCLAHGGGRRCKVAGCSKSAQKPADLCIAHGGGHRCEHSDCSKSARAGSKFCKTHGGGRRCGHSNCGKAAVDGYHFCYAHGGGRRCEHAGCSKLTQSATNFCIAHGGGRRCKQTGCSKLARPFSPFCTTHAESSIVAYEIAEAEQRGRSRAG